MPPQSTIHRDSKALAFAAFAAVVLSFVNPVQAPEPTSSPDVLIDARAAQASGAWWLDEPNPTARISFAPEYERLVWRVGTDEHSVLLDATTGEALAFEFE